MIHDEDFWQAQQARRERGFGQPCCTQSGMSWTMIDMPGDFAVVIHGEFDCVNCFHHHIGRSAANYYSTRLTEAQLTSGETAEPLERCLRLIAEQRRPEAVIVLGTCPVEVIGDRFETVVKAVAADTGIPMVPLHTSGLTLSSQGEMLDWLFDTLAALPAAPANDPPGINLIGLPEGHPEPIELLGGAGIAVNGVYPYGASITDWRRIRTATASFVTDRKLFPRLLHRLKKADVPIVETPLPIGLAASRAYYGVIGQHLDRADAVAAEVQQRAAGLDDRLEALRRRTAGLRMAVGVRMMNTYAIERVARAGLGEAFALQEAGFDVTLLVQGAPESSDDFAETLASWGCDLPFQIFPGPYALEVLLRDGDFDATVLSDSSRGEARAANVRMLDSGALEPFIAGVGPNLHTLGELARALGR